VTADIYGSVRGLFPEGCRMIFYENKSDNLSCFYGSNMTYPLHIHKELEILVLIKGEIEFLSNSIPCTLEQGDIIFTFPNTVHGYKTHDHSEYFLLIFNGDMLSIYKNVFANYKSSASYIQSSQVPEEVYIYLRCIHEEVMSENNAGMITGYLYLAVSRLLPLLDLCKKQKNNNDLIERILSYIQSNYMNPINLSSIADELKISPFYLSRIFSVSIGQRIDRYINELRINFANYLLSYTDKPITEIAFECGFETMRTFNRVYKSIMNITPREYRKQMTDNPQPLTGFKQGIT